MTPPPPPASLPPEPSFSSGLQAAIALSVIIVPFVALSLPSITDSPPLEVAMDRAAWLFFWASYLYLLVAGAIFEFLPPRPRRPRYYSWLLATLALWSVPASRTFAEVVCLVVKYIMLSGPPYYLPR